MKEKCCQFKGRKMSKVLTYGGELLAQKAVSVDPTAAAARSDRELPWSSLAELSSGLAAEDQQNISGQVKRTGTNYQHFGSFPPDLQLMNPQNKIWRNFVGFLLSLDQESDTDTDRSFKS